MYKTKEAVFFQRKQNLDNLENEEQSGRPKTYTDTHHTKTNTNTQIQKPTTKKKLFKFSFCQFVTTQGSPQFVKVFFVFFLKKQGVDF